MTVMTDSSLEQIINLSQQMLTDEYGTEERDFLEIIHSSASKLQTRKVFGMNLLALATNSHDLLQDLTAVVGYSALLASPKLADHDNYTPAQQEQLQQLHDLSRQLHWRLDSLILFASYISRAEPEKAKDAGLLDIRGYLLAQANNHICRHHLQEINVPLQIPLIYANDIRTKLMLRGLFVAAIELIDEPQIHLSAYTMMKVVRAKLSVIDAADKLPQVLKLVDVRHVTSPDDEITHAMIVRGSGRYTSSLVELGLYIATTLADKQGGRIKAEADGSSLVFTLTMPAVPKL